MKCISKKITYYLVTNCLILTKGRIGIKMQFINRSNDEHMLDSKEWIQLNVTTYFTSSLNLLKNLQIYFHNMLKVPKWTRQCGFYWTSMHMWSTMWRFDSFTDKFTSIRLHSTETFNNSVLEHSSKERWGSVYRAWPR